MDTIIKIVPKIRPLEKPLDHISVHILLHILDPPSAEFCTITFLSQRLLLKKPLFPLKSMTSFSSSRYIKKAAIESAPCPSHIKVIPDISPLNPPHTCPLSGAALFHKRTSTKNMLTLSQAQLLPITILSELTIFVKTFFYFFYQYLIDSSEEYIIALV